jgi:hypothetical protein
MTAVAERAGAPGVPAEPGPLVRFGWAVSDASSRETMAAYYAGLRAGLGRGDALRQAKLEMLKRTDRRHPFYRPASSSPANGPA